MKIAFLGTPDFAIPSLKMLIASGHELAVFTQPDKPVGRQAKLTPPPVKLVALEYGIPVYQFTKIRSDAGQAALEEFAPDLMVTAAFGQILSADNLAVPKYGCINVHGSLLPKYRGAAPIQWAIINGEEKTGITTMLTDIGLDTGDILLQKELQILPNETSGELFSRMADLGAETLRETIIKLQDGTLQPVKQDETMATKCGMLKKERAKIDFSQSALSVHNLIRGMNPWPCAYATLGQDIVKIWSARPVGQSTDSVFGEVVMADSKKGVFVNCGGELLELLDIQYAGSKRMPAKLALMGKPMLGKVFE